MKLIYSLALLFLLGCQSKPKPVMDAAKWNTITRNVFRHHELPPEGVTWHVTQAQWQAAQGLYNSEVFCEGGKSVMLKYPDGSWRPYSHTDAMKMHSVTVACAPPYPSLTIFPPSGDAK